MSRRAGKVRLGDVLSVKARIGWQGLTQKEHRETGEYNLVTGTDFVDGKVDFSKCVFVDKERYDQDENIQLRNGDLLITKDGTIGKVAVVENMPRPATLNSGVFVVRDVTSSFFIRYLYHFFLAPEFRKLVDGKLTGCTIAHLNQKVLVNLTIPLPPLSAQQRIADELDRLCALKKNAEDRLAILDQIVKSRFVEMFGDPVVNPKGWDKRKISDFAEVRIGPFGSLLHKDDYVTGGHPLVNPSHIKDGRVDADDDLTLTDEKYEELKAYHLKVGDVVVARRGEIGRCALVEREGLLCGTGSMFVRVRDSCRADYLQRVISFPTYTALLENGAVGVTMKNINASMVEDALIPLPPMSAQGSFSAFVAEVDKSKLTLRETVATLDQLYRAKLQEYFG